MRQAPDAQQALLGILCHLAATIALLNVTTGVVGASEPVKTLTSFYSTESCAYWERRGRHDCPTASGTSLYWLETHQPFFAASWDYPLGRHLRVCQAAVGTQREPSRCVDVAVMDRGPAKRLVRAGRRLDLSRQAFQAVCGSLDHGTCQVEIRQVQ